MKSTLLFLFALTLPQALHAEDLEKKLVGYWGLDGDFFLEMIKEQAAEALAAGQVTEEQLAQQIAPMLNQIVMQFAEDGTGGAYTPDGFDGGDYSVKASRPELKELDILMESQADGPEEATVTFLADDKILLQPREENPAIPAMQLLRLSQEEAEKRLQALGALEEVAP
ncbi:MAG: hypothetical protein AAF555_09125 [Verrucomicrobiota bacterium]